jgi:hypothetical protein
MAYQDDRREESGPDLVGQIGVGDQADDNQRHGRRHRGQRDPPAQRHHDSEHDQQPEPPERRHSQHGTERGRHALAAAAAQERRADVADHGRRAGDQAGVGVDQ